MKKWTFIALALLAGGCSSGIYLRSSHDSGYSAGNGRRAAVDSQASVQAPASGRVTVAKGDTLYSIAKRRNAQLRDVIEANRLQPPYTLKLGQVLSIPGTRYHTVEKGDTLYSISRRYGSDVTSLSRLNGLQPPYALALGQKIAISSSVSVEGGAVAKAASAAKPAGADPAKAASSRRAAKFAWPVRGGKVVSPFGTIAKGKTNDGINIAAPAGTSVDAADAGTVAYAGSELKGFGNLILIKHPDGWITAYAHNEKLLVKKGQKVARGEKIATVGTSGGVPSPQLHFETRAGKKPLNPVDYLQ